MSEILELNQGEVKVRFTSPPKGKVSFLMLGLTDENLFVDGGNFRMVFDLEGIPEHSYYHVPTLEITYEQEMEEIHWQCEFNDEVILDTYDHHGHSSILLLNRNKIGSLEHHHKNSLIVRADFPQSAKIIAAKSFFHFFK